MQNEIELSGERRSELLVGSFVNLVFSRIALWCVDFVRSNNLGSFGFDVLEFFSDFDTFRTVQPGLMPVDIGVGSRCGTNGRQHPFSRVLAWRTFGCSGTFKVVDQDVGTGSNFSKVDSLSALGEEQESVKVFKQDGRRLVDGAQDGLTVSSQLSEQLQDVPRGLRVETRGRFIQEEQESGFSDQLDTDGQSLSLLDVET